MQTQTYTDIHIQRKQITHKVEVDEVSYPSPPTHSHAYVFLDTLWVSKKRLYNYNENKCVSKTHIDIHTDTHTHTHKNTHMHTTYTYKCVNTHTHVEASSHTHSITQMSN